MTATQFDNYSVGGFCDNGAKIGKEFYSLENATAYLHHLEELDWVASATLYGYTAEGDCEELDGFAKG